MLPKSAEFAVDLGHLDRYTGGNRAVNQEILVLFENQCNEMLTRLEELAGAEADPKSWRMVTHTLKGAARGIGAFPLADAAAEAEAAGPSDHMTAVHAVEAIKLRSAAVHTFIENFLKQQA